MIGSKHNSNRGKTPPTVPSSPFFQPSTPHVVVVQQTPGGTRRSIKQKDEVHEHKTGLLGCMANLINAIVGAGIVGIPYAMREAGFGAGIVLIVLCAIMTEKSLRLLIATAKHIHVPTYEMTAEAAFGKIGFRFVAFNMFILAYGAMISYLLIVKDSFSIILGIDPHNLPMKRAVLFAISICIMVPLSSRRDMADLAFTSRLNVFIDSILVGLVAWNAPISTSLESIGGFMSLLSKDRIIHMDTIFIGLGVLSFAFVCQHSAFIIAGSLETPTQKRWSRVTLGALGFSSTLSMICGLMGYMGYLDQTQGNILNNLDPSSVSANVARAMLGTTMLFVYPMESFVARHVCVILLFAGRRAHEGEDSAILNRPDRRIGLTVLLYLLAVLPAAMFEDLGSVLAVTGAVGGSCISYIGPGLVFMGVHGGRFLELVENSWFSSRPKQQPQNGPEAEKKPLVVPMGVDMNKHVDSDGATSNGKVPSSLAISTLTETTPLVKNEREALQVAKLAQERKLQQEEAKYEEGFVMYVIKGLAWYLTGMPLWVSIASAGRKGLTWHVHDMALKSPHPIRIGDVEYKRVAVTRSGRIEADPDEVSAVVLPPGLDLAYNPQQGHALPMLATKPPTAGGPANLSSTTSSSSIDQQIGQSILARRRQEQEQRKKIITVEQDPVAEPPGWWDFMVAIFFMLFGFLALFAGLFSIISAS